MGLRQPPGDVPGGYTWEQLVLVMIKGVHAPSSNIPRIVVAMYRSGHENCFTYRDLGQQRRGCSARSPDGWRSEMADLDE